MAEKNGIADQLELIKAYARQQTLDPLKGSGRWVGMGLLGSVLLVVGGVSMTLALLRVLQEETGTNFTGNLSWVPYLLTMTVLIAVMVLLGLRIRKKTL
ncbi:MAG: hypothetical protein ACPHJY_14080 [Acidimicrobiales bacterium]